MLRFFLCCVAGVNVLCAPVRAGCGQVDDDLDGTEGWNDFFHTGVPSVGPCTTTSIPRAWTTRKPAVAPGAAAAAAPGAAAGAAAHRWNQKSLNTPAQASLARSIQVDL